MSIIKEFREFAVKGNMVDMAVGIIIGAAFGKLINALVGDLIMPVIGLVMGGIDFNQLFINLGGGGFETLKAAEEAGAPVLKYGSFLQTGLDFLIIAFAVFMLVKVINRLKRQQAEAPAGPSEEVKLLSEIRDALKRK
ncbi:MAG: large conductance mechanosensitive channel protein MscL [Thiotrichales bacterium]